MPASTPITAQFARGKRSAVRLRDSRSSRLSGGVWIFDVVTPQRAEVSDVKPAIRHDGIRPGLLLAAIGLVRRREAAFLAIRVGCRLDERQVAVLTVKIKTAVGKGK